jgi:hypothetical protein
MHRTLPSQQDVVRLKAELNFLLWTNDPCPVPENLLANFGAGSPVRQMPVNIQCTAHALITSAVLMRRGCGVTHRGGEAYLITPSPAGSAANDRLHKIARHWWVSVEGKGLVDLSLFADALPPLIYLNHSVGTHWDVVYGHDGSKVGPFLKARRRGCLYITLAKKTATQASLEQSLAEPFRPASAVGIRLPYRKVADHCDRLLDGACAPFSGISQIEAWRSLAAEGGGNDPGSAGVPPARE